jgi:fluoride ion exporter CrcB/FEX
MSIVVPLELYPKGPAVAAPARRLGSIRRTSTIDSVWPNGIEANREVIGRSRDLLTPADGSEPVVLAEDALIATVAPDRGIIAMESVPPREAIQALVGATGGSNSRGRVVDAVPEEVAAGTPLYLLLDDLSGATLVGSVALRFWQTPEELEAQMKKMEAVMGKRVMQGICAGFAPGSTALNEDGTNRTMGETKPVPDIENPDDSWAWHELTKPTQASHRRSRRIDVWLEDGVVRIEAFFQDSYTSPEGQRHAVHEYEVSATADPATGNVLSISADPRVLPHYECPMATLSVGRMVGQPLRNFRDSVNEKLPGIDGCTHMNDTLRSLAEVPVLVAQLPN